jgi:hypothetical protein
MMMRNDASLDSVVSHIFLGYAGSAAYDEYIWEASPRHAGRNVSTIVKVDRLDEGTGDGWRWLYW